jgi:hypothetical protein
MAAFFEYAAMPITDPIAARICDLFFENKQIVQDLDAADEIFSELGLSYPLSSNALLLPNLI